MNVNTFGNIMGMMSHMMAQGALTGHNVGQALVGGAHALQMTPYGRPPAITRKPGLPSPTGNTIDYTQEAQALNVVGTELAKAIFILNALSSEMNSAYKLIS